MDLGVAAQPVSTFTCQPETRLSLKPLRISFPLLVERSCPPQHKMHLLLAPVKQHPTKPLKIYQMVSYCPLHPEQ